MAKKVPSGNQPRSPKRRRFLRAAIATVATAGGTVLYGTDVEADRLVVTRQAIRLPGWPTSHAGYKIGQLSDFHCNTSAALKRTQRAVAMLLAEKPDIVLLTGDYVDQRPEVWAAPCARALSPLTAVHGGVFAILGNHDWWCQGQRRMKYQLTKYGMRLLRNESVPFPDVPGVWIVGLDDRCVNKQNPELALKDVPANSLKILLVHEPDYADEIGPGFALQLSGHSHGGQVCLPFLPPIYTPTYARKYRVGLEQSQNHPVYTTRGVGMIGPPIRLFCPPEVTVLTLSPEAT